MERFSFFSTLRGRLILLVLIATLPAAGLLIYYGLEGRAKARVKALDETLRLASDKSVLYENIIMNARQTLSILSQLHQLQQHGPEVCSAIFASLLRETEAYTGLAAAKPDGEVFASAPPIARPANFADRQWFQRVMQTRGFVIGEYVLGRISGKPLIVLGYPVLDHTGEITTVLCIGLDLAWMEKSLRKSELAKGMSLTVIDSNGTILVRLPDPENLIGKAMPEQPLIRTMLTRGEGVAEGVGLDGKPCLLGFTSVGKRPEAIHMGVSIPRHMAFADVRRSTVQSLILVALVAVIGLVGGWFISGLFVLSPVTRLLHMTKQLTAGDLAIRRERPYVPGEIGQLAYHFELMADSLKRREAERDRAEEALRESEEKYRTILSDMEEGYYEVDLAGNFLFFNDAVPKFGGYSRDEFMGTNYRDYTDEETAKQLYKVYNQVYTNGTPVKGFEWKIIRKDGTELYMEVSIFLNTKQGFKGNPIGFRGLLRDVTERKEEEEENRKLEAQFLHAQKMEAVGRLAGGIAHDFNNLLTTIIGYTGLVMLHMGKDNPLYGNLEEINRAAKSAASLIRQLLAFSRRQIIQPVVLNLNRVAGGIEKMLRRLIGEDIELVTILEADPGQIEQVIMNLAVNAKDALPQGGKITIETANVDLDDVYASNHGVELTPGPYVMLAVSDTGMGMDKETQSKIFEPFFTTKEKGKGTGLGLSTVYGMVKQSHGFIWVYSEPGKGTTFKLYFPRAEKGEIVRKENPSLGKVGGSETILVVEDDQSVRGLAASALSNYGYAVIEAETGEEALETFSQHEEEIHLLLADVVLPGMSGRELAERLTSRYPQTKVLYMSGYAYNAIVHQGVLEEGIEFIQKPFSPEPLARKVREVLDA